MGVSGISKRQQSEARPKGSSYQIYVGIVSPVHEMETWGNKAADELEINLERNCQSAT